MTRGELTEKASHDQQGKQSHDRHAQRAFSVEGFSQGQRSAHDARQSRRERQPHFPAACITRQHDRDPRPSQDECYRQRNRPLGRSVRFRRRQEISVKAGPPRQQGQGGPHSCQRCGHTCQIHPRLRRGPFSCARPGQVREVTRVVKQNRGSAGRDQQP